MISRKFCLHHGYYITENKFNIAKFLGYIWLNIFLNCLHKLAIFAYMPSIIKNIIQGQTFERNHNLEFTTNKNIMMFHYIFICCKLFFDIIYWYKFILFYVNYLLWHKKEWNESCNWLKKSHNEWENSVCIMEII